jgi:hypothetical protein
MKSEEPTMKRMSAAAATIALAASLLLTLPASAGGWATVTVVGPASAPVAGAPWPLELQVLQHGITPIDWEQVSLVGRDPASGMITAANGRPADTVGRYVMDVVFPAAGEWTLEFGLHQLALDQASPTTITVAGSATDGAEDAAIVGADAAACG